MQAQLLQTNLAATLSSFIDLNFMMFVWLLFLIANVVLASPSFNFRRQSNSTKLHSSCWNDRLGEKVTYKNGPGGQYSISWSGVEGNFVCGKGWNSGGAR